MVKFAVLLGAIAGLVSALHIQPNHQDWFPEYAITIQAANGAYLARCRNCGPSDHPDSASFHETNPDMPYAQWERVNVDSRVAFKSDTGKYLAICPDCWKDSTSQSDAVFVYEDTPTENALWTLSLLTPTMQSKWAFKGKNGKWLASCSKCVPGGSYENYAFSNDESPGWNENAQFIVKGKWKA